MSDTITPSLTVERVVGEMPYGEEHPDSAIMLGGRPYALTWAEYLDEWRDEWVPRLTALRGYVASNGMVGMNAGEAQTQTHYFRFSDGATLAFSARAWGDFMSAVVGKREGYLRYFY